MPSTLHRRAIGFMIVAALCWSSGGILVRQLSITNAWEIVYWRSLFMALFVIGVLVALHGRGMPRAVVAAGWPGIVSGTFLAGTFFFFIASLTRTTVANTFVIMSASPFLAAIAGRLVLKETVPARTWTAMAVASAGIVVMFSDSLDAGAPSRPENPCPLCWLTACGQMQRCTSPCPQYPVSQTHGDGSAHLRVPVADMDAVE